MIVHNIDIFEKLKIRAVDIKNISAGNGFIRIDPNSITLDDLRPGYVMKAKNKKQYLFMTMDQLEKIFGTVYDYDTPAFVRPDNHTYSGASYIALTRYKLFFPEHKTPDFDITDIWDTGVDTSDISSVDMLCEFFDNYKIYDL